MGGVRRAADYSVNIRMSTGLEWFKESFRRGGDLCPRDLRSMDLWSDRDDPSNDKIKNLERRKRIETHSWAHQTTLCAANRSTHEQSQGVASFRPKVLRETFLLRRRVRQTVTPLLPPCRQNRCWTQSVPPRGSGWVRRRLTKQQQTFASLRRTHPLPRGGTDRVQVLLLLVIRLREIQRTLRNTPHSQKSPSA